MSFLINEIFNDLLCKNYFFQQYVNASTNFLLTKYPLFSIIYRSWELPQSPSRSMVSKQRPRFSMNSFPSYIKLFEPNVIQSLKVSDFLYYF